MDHAAQAVDSCRRGAAVRGTGSADAAITFTLAKLALADCPSTTWPVIWARRWALDLTLERVGVLGGRLEGALDLESRERTTRLRLRGHALPLGRLLEVTGVSSVLRDGVSTLDLELNGSGATTHALMSGLNGIARVDVAEGRVSNRVFDLLQSDVRALLKPLLAGDDETLLRCAVTRFDVSGGVARSRVLALDATRFTVSGAGSVDLGRESISIDLEPRSRDASLAGVVVPLRIRGSLAAPSACMQPARSVDRRIDITRGCARRRLRPLAARPCANRQRTRERQRDARTVVRAGARDRRGRRSAAV